MTKHAVVRLACALLAAVVAVLAIGCGGESEIPTASPDRLANSDVGSVPTSGAVGTGRIATLVAGGPTSFAGDPERIATLVAGTPASVATTPPTASSSGAPGIDPCSLVTRAEAEAAFGFPAQEPAAKGAVCRYDTVQQTKFFDLTARTGTTKDFESAKNLCGSAPPAVPGLGDNSCSTNNTVVVLAKDVLITIIAGGNFNQDNLVAIAKTAASRVP